MRLSDPGWTPSAKDAGALLDLIATASDDEAKSAEKALLRVEAQQAPKIAAAVLERLANAVRPGRGRLAKVAGRYRDQHAVHAWLVAALADADPKTRRNAARSLGAEAEAELLRAFDAAETEDDRKAFGEALSKIGSKDARERIERIATGDARMTRAAVIRDREEARSVGGRIDLEAAFGDGLVVRYHTRVGLERIAIEELGEEAHPRLAAPGIVEAKLFGALSSTMHVRTATHVGFPLDTVRIRNNDPADAIAGALSGTRARKIFAAFTDGPARFRLAMAGPGHHRQLVWKVAELVRARTADIVNDPKESVWEVSVSIANNFAELELIPRGYDDPRFAYRVAMVPASSHPTIAAALARIAPKRANDVVWDPFVGAGAELVERARLGPYARLIGTDVEPDAIDAARKNLGGISVELRVADALQAHPAGVTAIITNPPMGRRVERGKHAELLARFVEHAAEVLVPSGVLVWAVPEPKDIHERAAKAGLVLERAFTVDMGGFPAALSIHRKERKS